ncbi:MAG: hypothetical protein GDA44_06235 [Prochloron sp. SP5CPC1]|nr:hypothetical protein [Candidatus Paraprochloron terpiosi SP5CPC1]
MSELRTISLEHQFDNDKKIWSSLKQAIANSSGFKCWQQERTADRVGTHSASSLANAPVHGASLDYRVRCYLQETLETLAY